MKNNLFILLALLLSKTLFAQNISGVINNYTQVTNINVNVLTVNSSVGFNVGDKVMLIKMKGATIDQSNTASFGDTLSLGEVGQYAFSYIQCISPTSVTLYPYCANFGSSDYLQLVSVPVFPNPSVTGTLTCAPWNGYTGGILIFETPGILTLNADIDVSSKGYLGGNDFGKTYNCSNNNFYTSLSSHADGKKGEGVAEYILNKESGRGKLANGGGGAYAGNAGAGGGANVGNGGNGGNEYSGCGQSGFAGIGGQAITHKKSALLMGGGGGGPQNDNNQTAYNGGNGGGIVFIAANEIIGNSYKIKSNGGSVPSTNDEGSSAGGAGGSVILNCSNYSNTLQIETEGGNGGSNYNTIFSSDCHGTGGGGGGGLTWFSTSGLPANVIISSAGGLAGLILNPASSCYNTTYFAQNGGLGEVKYDFTAIGICATPPGAALHFDGTNDYVTINNMTATTNSNYTIEGWFKTSLTGQVQDIVSGATAADSAVLVVEVQLNGTLRFLHRVPAGNGILTPGTSVYTTSAVNNGAWHHFAAVHGADEMKLYLDGVLQGQSIFPELVSPDILNINLGRLFNNTRIFQGSMDEIRFWNRALCAAEIVNNMNCEIATTGNALVANYHFNQGVASSDNSSPAINTLIDATGNGFTGTLNNFALIGNTSNWIAPGGIICGINCVAYTASEINLQGNSVTIFDGDASPSSVDYTDFGNVVVGNNLVRTFTIQNTGTAVLNVSSITSDNATYTISGAPTSITAGNSATFNVTFSPTVIGTDHAIITINNNDCDEGVYNFYVQGTGTCTFPSIICSANVVLTPSSATCDTAYSYTTSSVGIPSPTITYSMSGATSASGSGNGSGTSFALGLTTVKIYVSNVCGIDSCTFTVTITDTTKPTIACPGDISINNPTGLCGTVINYNAPVGSDNCAGFIISQTEGLASGDAFPGGTTINKFIITDASGNKDSCTFVVTINDTTKPIIVCPANITQNNDAGACGAIVNYPLPTATDNCLTYSGSPLQEVLAKYNTHSALIAATIPNKYTFSMDGPSGVNGQYIGDGGNDMYDGGNCINTNFADNIFYSDNTILNSTAFGTNGKYFTRYTSASGIFMMAADLDNVSVLSITGNVGADLSGSQDAYQFNLVSHGINYKAFVKRIYNAGDPSVNHLFIIPDNPLVTRVTGSSTDDDLDQLNNLNATRRVYYLLYAGTSGFYINNAATNNIAQTFLDNVTTTIITAATITIKQTSGFPTGSVFPVGITTNEFVATDFNGNADTCSFTVTVVDTTKPIISCHSNITQNRDSGICGAVVNYTPLTASDNCIAFLGSTTLDSVLLRYNTHSALIAATVPNKYTFSMDGPGGVNGQQIGDGGNDMYDGGNFINTNFASNILYSDNTILNSSAFGASGKYFTRYTTTSGIFMMAADLDNVSMLSITGNIGADGSGSQDAYQFNLVSNAINYKAFVKRIYNAGDPSVNHLFLIPDNPSVTRVTGSSTDNDLDQLNNLNATTRVYYLLYAGTGGFYIDNTATATIAQTFLDNVTSIALPVGISQTLGLPSGSVFPVGTTTNQFVATDPSGNTDTCTFTVTITSPEIDVEGNSLSIVDGAITPILADHSDFGQTTIAPITRTFTIHNTGTANLTLAAGAITITGVNASLFTLSNITLPATLSSPSGSVTFDVTYTPTALGIHNATINIANNDCDEHPYNFDIKGERTCTIPVFTTCPTDTVHSNTILPLCNAVVNYTSIASGIPTPVYSYSFSGVTTGSGSGTGSGSIFTLGITTVQVIATNPCGADTCTFIVNMRTPEMDVFGNMNSIADGDMMPSLTDLTNFGNVSIATNLTQTFFIYNSGTGNLFVPGFTLSGVDSAAFVVSNITLPATVALSSFVAFNVTFTPGTVGLKNATLHIINDDCNENTYDFALRGNGTCTPTFSSSSHTACNSFIWNMNTYTTSGAYTFTYTNAEGCDSVYTLNLTINYSSINASTIANVCSTYVWQANGLTYTATGIYTHSFTNNLGCDSTVSLNLTLGTPSINTPTTADVCNSYLWNANAQTYTSSGTYTATFNNVSGCDSSVVLNLIIRNSTSSSSTVSMLGCYTWNANNVTYTATGVYTATLTNAANCDSVLTLNLTITPSVTISAKAILAGAYNSNTGLMNDSLRVLNLIPNAHPYSSSPFFKTPIAEASNETVSNAILSVTGNNAIVDWIFIELRSALNPSTVIANKRALIQRDGDIVSSTDGTSPVTFTTVYNGNYYVSIKHRNHVGIMSATAILFSGCANSIVDFTTSSPVYNNPLIVTSPRKNFSGVYALWAADANNNKNVKYNGISNDKEKVLIAVGAPNAEVAGYRVEDINLDGKVRYNNTDNDRQVILNTVGVSTPNIVIGQHTPN